MDTRPIRIHPFLPPLLIGLLSLFGLCVILALAFFPQQNVESVPSRTPTPFKYAFLATETLTPSSPTETAEPPEILFVPVAKSDIPSPISESTEQSGTPPGGSVTPDPIFGLLEPLIAGIYDDADAGFAYIGAWNPEENIDAYQRTIFVSDAVDDYMAFSFLGYQLHVGYQSSDDAGEITIDIDGVEMTVTQQVGSLWISGEFPLETHYVTITHTGEGPVNLDFIEIPE